MKNIFKTRLGTSFWLKGLAVLLLVILLFTVVSRVAASFTVAKVSVESISSRRIQHTVSAVGQIEQNGETAVVTEADLLVKSLEVSVGQKVMERDLLAVLDPDDLSEKISSVKGEISALELQNDSLHKNQGQAAQNRQKDIERASQDYEETVSKNGTNIAAATQEYEEANIRLAEAEQALREAESRLAAVQAEQQNAAAQAGQQNAAAQAEQTGQQSEEAQQNEDAQRISAGQPAGSDSQQTGGKSQPAGASDLENRLAAATADVEEKKSVYLECQASAAEKRAALETAYDTQQSEEKTARRNLEDAQTDMAADNSDRINDISIEQLRKKLEKLQALQAQEGKITAEQSGVITALYVTVGQKTTETALLTMSNESAGVKFVAQIEKEDADYVSVGDSVELKGVGKTANDCKVLSVNEDETGQMLSVTVSVDSDVFSIGESATMTVSRDSVEYSCTIPVTALRQEENKMFVLILDTENTVLGEQYVARKIEVEVEDKNTAYAALNNSSLGKDSEIIVDSDRFVDAGDKVRLMEE